MDNIVLIGAGKLASSLVPALCDGGLTVKHIVSRNIKSAEILAHSNDIKSYSSDFTPTVIRYGIFLLTVPDNEIQNAAIELSNQQYDFDKCLFIHFSGALDLSALQVLSDKGARTASMHLMQSFPSRRRVKLQNIFAAIETENPDTHSLISEIAGKLGLRSFLITPGNKILYHLAGVFASNFLISDIYMSEKMYEESRDKGPDYYEVLLPLIESTIKNASLFGAAEALSGPVERGDLNTIRNHIEGLKKLQKPGPSNPDLALLNYIAQSLTLIEIVSRGKGFTGSQTAIRELLINELHILKLD